MVTRDNQEELAQNYLGVLQDEVRYRQKMENDILKDVQVILSAQGEELDKVREFLEGEEIYAEGEYLKALVFNADMKYKKEGGLALKDIKFMTEES